MASQTKNFPKDQVQIIRMSRVSDTNFILAEPHIESIIENLEQFDQKSLKLYLSLMYSFSRPVIYYVIEL